MKITRHTEPDCPHCESPVRFELFDAHGTGFSVDLATVLVCLSLAEQAGHIPPVSPGWWLETRTHLQLNIPSTDNIPLEDFPNGCVQTPPR